METQEIISQDIRELYGFFGDKLVLRDDFSVVGEHRLVGPEDPVARCIGRLYVESSAADQTVFVKPTRHKGIKTAVYCKLKGTRHCTTCYHMMTPHDCFCDRTQLVDPGPPDEPARYSTQVTGLLLAEGTDHRNHELYRSDQVTTATLIDDTASRSAMKFDLHPMLSSRGKATPKSRFGWSDDEDGKGNRAGDLQDTKADFCVVNGPKVFDEGFELSQLVLGPPTDDKIPCRAYGYANLSDCPAEYILSVYPFAQPADIRRLQDLFARTFIPDQLASVEGSLFTFAGKFIALFSSSVERGFSHGPVITEDKEGNGPRLLGWIIGANAADNRNLVLLASHPIVRSLLPPLVNT